MDQFLWLRITVVLIVAAVLLVLWRWLPVAINAQDVASWLSLHRQAWYGLPAVVLLFIALALFPVTLLIAATGVAFGPILGPIYAMAGCLASGSIGFAIGRRLGRRRVEELCGERIVRISRQVRANGTLAVFLVRKVPAPFTLANIVLGASRVAYRDFLIGTLLGMGVFVIALAGFGYQMTQALRNPSPETIATALLFIGVPLTLAWLINHALRPARPAE